MFSFVSIIALVYIAIDWATDFLILTPTRVIFEDTQLLVRQIQQEIVIANIQQVNVRADSYLAYLLGYVRNWWQRIIQYNKKIKGWHMTPSHYLWQDLSTVWLDG